MPHSPTSPARPPPQLLRAQAEWLAPARARLLRQVAIAHRRHVLDLGAGPGAVTGELARRCGGAVTAVDLDLGALRSGFSGSSVAVCANGLRLPFADGSFDLVFCQCALMWIAGGAELGDAGRAIREIRRVLEPAGVLIALEPDYGGMIEHPPSIATRDLWLAGLARAGADPYLGRRLPGMLESAGFAVRVDLIPRLMPPAAARFDLLRGLPLTPGERRRLEAAAMADLKLEAGTADGGEEWGRVAHLPFFLVTTMAGLDGLGAS